MSVASATSVEKLDENNYEVWALQMRSVLIYNDLWNYASGDAEMPADKTKIEEWKKKDEKALAIIILGVKENQLSHIKEAGTSKEAWEKLKNVHTSKDPVKKVMLYKKLFKMKKDKEKNMNDHLREFQNLVDKMEEIDVTIGSELKTIMLLNTLPEDWENFFVAIESRDELP